MPPPSPPPSSDRIQGPGHWLRLLAALTEEPDPRTIGERACRALATAPGVARAELADSASPIGQPTAVRRFPLPHAAAPSTELRLTLADPAAFAATEDAARDFCALLDLLLEQVANRQPVRAQTAPPSQERSHTFAQILDAVPQPVFWKDSSSVYLGCNRVFARIAGLPNPEAIIGKTDLDLPWAKTEAEAYRADDRTIMAERTGRRIVEPLRQADGSQIWIETTKVPLVDDAGSVCGILGVFQDITESRRLAEQLRQVAIERSTLLDTITTGIAFLKNRRLEWVNPAFAKMFGYEASEITGMGTAVFYAHPEDYQRVGTVGYPEVAAGRVYSTLVEMRHRDGTRLWCTLTGRAISSENPEIGTIWALHDITALKESEAAFRSLFASSPVAICLLRDHQIQRVNAQMCRITGYTETELVGQSPRILHAEEGTYLTAVEKLYGQMEQDGFGTFEAHLRRKDGARLDTIIYVTPLDPEEPAKGIIATILDITQRKHAEQRYRTVIQTMIDGFWQLDGHGRIIDVNDAICAMLGYSRDELLARSLADLETDENAGALTGRLAQSPGPASDRFETRLRRKDGAALAAEISLGAAQGDAAGFFVFIRDISEQVRANESIRAANARLESIFRAAPVGIALIANRVMLEINDGTTRLTGYSREDLLGKPTRFLYPTEEDFARVGTLYRRLGEDPPPMVSTRWFRKDGSIMDVLMHAAPLDPDAPEKGAMAVAVDISELKRAEQQIRNLARDLEQRVKERTEELARRVTDVERLNADLRASRAAADVAAARLVESNASLHLANQELESFTYTVSHDLRAPLRNIAGFIELLRRRTTGHTDPESERFLGIVGSEAVRMSALIDDLLAFSRIGRAELHLAPVNLAELIDEVKIELSSEMTGRAIEWRIAPLPPVRGDRALLRQVVANLLSNAVKFTGRRPAALIEFGVLAAPGEAEDLTFFVRDNGAGFDPRYADKLFGVFQRLHNPREFDGTGIGLANVKRIIVRHGGRVWAEGAPEQGATFYFTLHRAEPDESAVA